MPALDVLTPRGQKALGDERRAMAAFSDRFCMDYVETPKGSAAYADGVLVKEKELRAVVEVKCRYDVDIDGFFLDYNGEWLVTAAKLERCRRAASYLSVPFIGFLHLVNSKKLLWKRVEKWKTERTITTRTVNDPTPIRRANGFIDMEGAHCLEL